MEEEKLPQDKERLDAALELSALIPKDLTLECEFVGFKPVSLTTLLN